MRIVAIIAVLLMLTPLAGACCVHGLEISAAEDASQSELHAASGCHCDGESHEGHEDCLCLCQLPAAPHSPIDSGTALPLLGKVLEQGPVAARHLSIPQDRPPIFA